MFYKLLKACQAAVIFSGILIMSSCTPHAASTPAASPTTSTVTSSTTTATTVATATASQAPTSTTGTPSATPSVTLDDNGKTLQFQVGQRFLLALGSGYDWTVNVADSSVVSRVVNVLVVKGAQGIYEAKQPGRATLTAVGDPPCRKATPPCGAPSRMFKVDIVVN